MISMIIIITIMVSWRILKVTLPPTSPPLANIPSLSIAAVRCCCCHLNYFVLLALQYEYLYLTLCKCSCESVCCL
ncbi:hypothetical protein M5D96_003822, partial [Drosophila gunungcola]